MARNRAARKPRGAPRKRANRVVGLNDRSCMTVRTPGHAEPPSVINDVTHTQRFEYHGVTASGTVVVTIADLLTSIPGGSALWDRIRFTHFEVWGADNPTTAAIPSSESGIIRVTLLSSSTANFNGDTPSFQDAGTLGSTRAHVSFRPDMFSRLQWNDSTSTNGILAIDTPFSVESFIIHFTCDIRSSATTNPTFSAALNAASRSTLA